ncbi:vasoactive intestinal polypeptide receptor 2 [Suricata suricatta]|uniref:vasoactive intestinal polypeptide receptor 2 n=1 Tax=Suricata suricatta TaxID=37032 RepID=UPI0011556B5B|nr:vasoactive intestinal polypeptide receptor 2 [Suricata suricatta]
MLCSMRPSSPRPSGPGSEDAAVTGTQGQRTAVTEDRLATETPCRSGMMGAVGQQQRGAGGRTYTPSFSSRSPSTQSPEGHCGARLALQGSWPSLLSHQLYRWPPGCLHHSLASSTLVTLLTLLLQLPSTSSMHQVQQHQLVPEFQLAVSLWLQHRKEINLSRLVCHQATRSFSSEAVKCGTGDRLRPPAPAARGPRVWDGRQAAATRAGCSSRREAGPPPPGAAAEPLLTPGGRGRAARGVVAAAGLPVRGAGAQGLPCLVNSVHPECRFHLEIQEEETKCAELLRTQTDKHKACAGVWDNITCWRPADVGETVTVPCPRVFSNFYSKPGNISKNCTSDGWSEMFPDFIDACGYNDPEDESKITFYVLVKAIYTLGYSVSLISLTTGSIILCLFSPDQPSSWVGCKLSLVLFQYCIMANFYWLLVEGLYLHTLLVAIFSPGRRFVAYLLIGWGIPTICTGAWTAARLSLEDTGCWDTNDHSVPWWLIRTPILVSIIVNFVLFVSIIRILLQKLTSPDIGGNDQSQYKRLTKSTLLLIPLFGVHYMVFAVFPIGISTKYQILFELCIGSFQGLVVAVLYCFLNSEVQSELKRKWRGWCPSRPCGQDYRLHGLSVSRNGSESALQLHRGSRAASFLQTETSVI